MRGNAWLLAAVLITACERDTGAPTAVAARLEPTTAMSFTGSVGVEVTPTPAVRATNARGRPLAGVAVSFFVSGGGLVGNTVARTDANGLATAANWILGPQAGYQSVTARAAGVADVVFTVLAVAGPATQLARYGGEDQRASVHEGLDRPLIVKVTDRAGNPVSGAPVKFTVIAGGGSIDKEIVLSDGNGLAESGPWTLGPDAGLQQVRAETGTLHAVFQAVAYLAVAGLPGQLAFVSEGDNQKSEIQVVNANGSLRRRLTTGGESRYDPAWSPDGSQLAFASDRDGASGIYVMSADGSNLTRRTHGRLDRTPAWSPNGSTIAFSTLNSGDYQIATVGKADTSIVVVTSGPGFKGQPTWSPDSRQLAYVSDWAFYDFVYDIYTINSNGSGWTQRTRSLDGWYHYLHPAWSPDGKTIAYVYGSLIRDSYMRFTVALMSAEGAHIRDLAWAGDIPWREALDPGSLTWSPDGSGVAFSFVECNLTYRNSCPKTRSVKYVSSDGSVRGTIVLNGHSPTWRR